MPAPFSFWRCELRVAGSLDGPAKVLQREYGPFKVIRIAEMLGTGLYW